MVKEVVKEWRLGSRRGSSGRSGDFGGNDQGGGVCCSRDGGYRGQVSGYNGRGGDGGSRSSRGIGRGVKEVVGMVVTGGW